MGSTKNNESKVIVLFVALFHCSGIASSINRPSSPNFSPLQLCPLPFSPSKMSNTGGIKLFEVSNFVKSLPSTNTECGICFGSRRGTGLNSYGERCIKEWFFIEVGDWDSCPHCRQNLLFKLPEQHTQPHMLRKTGFLLRLMVAFTAIGYAALALRGTLSSTMGPDYFWWPRHITSAMCVPSVL